MNKKTKLSNDRNNEKDSQRLLKELARNIKCHEIETTNNLIPLGSDASSEANLISELNQRTKMFGLEHPYSMHVFNVLGRLYSDRKDFKGMANLLRRSLKSRIDEFGINHPETLFTMNKLGRKLAVCKEYKEAEQMFRKSLEGFQLLLGVDHLLTKRCQNDLKQLKSIMNI